MNKALDADELLYSIQFYYKEQALTGADLCDKIPRSPELRKAFQRFCDLKYQALMEGLEPEEASRRAQALFDAETRAYKD